MYVCVHCIISIFQMITLSERVIKSFEVSALISSKALFQTQEVLLKSLSSNHYTLLPLYQASIPKPRVKAGPPRYKSGIPTDR